MERRIQMRLGIDIGSTTVKAVLLNQSDEIIYKRYERHMSDIFGKTKEILQDLKNLCEKKIRIGITGSGGLALAQQIGCPFEQEVIACTEAVQRLIPETDVAIELGGEDAKITFFGLNTEQRMNGTCAGGTGAFIDQMALLLNTDAEGLNEAAKKYSMIYPIAARCGVFAKTDIQPLINEGASKEDLAASIFQAVVNQTISGLACGRRIKGHVAFLGGPLTFLSELRKCFVKTLGLKDDEAIYPEHAEYYPAIGSAFLADKADLMEVSDILSKIKKDNNMEKTKHLPALFETTEQYRKFLKRHDKECVKRCSIENAKGMTFLGIDAGSTTTKLALTDKDGQLLYTDYKNNGGDPIATARKMLLELYSCLPEKAFIAYTVTTGYGEKLLKEAFRADTGEIETVAHYRAAKKFQPDVDFILDIGGQDMKCIRIKDGAISSIVLNEACSSGCGSFLETYAKSVGISVEKFANMAVKAQKPVDLGTRCTVFMNSRVKQAQKEGNSREDIAAGLVYSVIKNALYKVLKLRNPEEVGQHPVVQGGTFLNNGILAAFEKILGREVIRPDIAGIMGAYGAALTGIKEYVRKIKEHSITQLESQVLKSWELEKFQMRTEYQRCKRCQNHCQLTIHDFGNESRFITGNRCERGSGEQKKVSDELNLFQYKYKRLFQYKPLTKTQAERGNIGIPRALNIYENYPFWFTFFTELKFRVVISPTSSRKIYELGMDTIPSDTVCYPAKLTHGHVRWLAEHGVRDIFYPCITYEMEEDVSADNHYNCPVVGMYPEVIAGNMDDIFEKNETHFMHPFLPYYDDRRMSERLYEELKKWKISRTEIKKALAEARKEDIAFKQEIEKKAEQIIQKIEAGKGHGIVLSGRPYHLDPEINHGIDKVIASYGFAVLTESSVAHLSRLKRPIRVLDQWMYHSRLYKAADFCTKRPDMDLVQLNSFGCGIDAVTTDEVEEILNAGNKLYTVLKIDEGSNLGAARIRIRSLKAAIEERREITLKKESEPFHRVTYTEKMKQEYTLLIPQMAPMQFDLLEEAFRAAGYCAKVLPAVDKRAVDCGLKYINNDACYPTIVALGQILSALLSGEYNLDKTAVLMVQTGGGCRASNYIALLRKALKQLGMEQIPVVSFNGNRRMEQNPGMKFSLKFIYGMLYAVIYGDLFMRLTNAVRPYEKLKGSTEKLYKKWNQKVKDNIREVNYSIFKRNVREIVKAFDEIPVYDDMKKPKVGVVGEILVKYHPNANNHIVEIIEKEGGEAVVPDLLDFILYTLKNKEFNHQKMATSAFQYYFGKLGIRVLCHYRKTVEVALNDSKRFSSPIHIDEIAKKAEHVISLGTQCGEGWLLAGEMQELIDAGVNNIVCLQPFGCLPNHIVGKGMIKPLRKIHPGVNIAAIDYDPGASNVNQLNRIKLMMAVAHKHMETT